MARVGPLLAAVLAPEEVFGFLAIAGEASFEAAKPAPDAIAVVALVARRQPHRGEPWSAYREETLGRLAPFVDELGGLGLEPEPLIAAGGLQFSAEQDVIRHLAETHDDLELIELDPLVKATLLDDIPADIDLPSFHESHPGRDGAGITVAVLDTGVDTSHPALDVSESISTCGEPVEIPGVHGTHCAGIVASRDATFRGVAPGVRLLNVKVARSDGRLKYGDLTRGIDRALELGAHILSISLGYNHRPLWSVDGVGWSCSDEPCAMCRAVNAAVISDQHLVVVAAGNEHQHAEAMRARGQGDAFDTELCCPGQAAEAFTVGSITKTTWVPAESSSRGPGSNGAAKPDLAAPGVNVMSTIPVPRGADGAPVAAPPRVDLFGRLSGTSMATPVVTGIAALVAEGMVAQGIEPTPTRLKQALLEACAPLAEPAQAVGAGRARVPT